MTDLERENSRLRARIAVLERELELSEQSRRTFEELYRRRVEGVPLTTFARTLVQSIRQKKESGNEA